VNERTAWRRGETPYVSVPHHRLEAMLFPLRCDEFFGYRPSQPPKDQCIHAARYDDKEAQGCIEHEITLRHVGAFVCKDLSPCSGRSIMGLRQPRPSWFCSHTFRPNSVGKNCKVSLHLIVGRIAARGLMYEQSRTSSFQCGRGRSPIEVAET